MMDSLGQLIFFLLTPLSHIGASLFFAKPRFRKWITAAIWLLYVALMMVLPPDTPTLNFFLTLAIHFILFFVTTTGSAQEKGFLFFSYACSYTCIRAIITKASTIFSGILCRRVFMIVNMVLKQVWMLA